MEYKLKLDKERIDFLIDLIIYTEFESTNDKLLAKEIYVDLSLMNIEDDFVL